VCVCYYYCSIVGYYLTLVNQHKGCGITYHGVGGGSMQTVYENASSFLHCNDTTNWAASTRP